MKIAWPTPGKYIMALSGGVDSSALLDILNSESTKRRLSIEVAHFNHGWPGDDAYEKAVIEQVASYDLPLHLERARIPASEAAARTARYSWLRSLVSNRDANAIITAHHLDDYEETVILNLIRGTGRRGLTPFSNPDDIARPLLNVRKQELYDYATKHHLKWYEDTYNDDLRFTRNRVRHNLLPSLRAKNPIFDDVLSHSIQKAKSLNDSIDLSIESFLKENASFKSNTCSLQIESLNSLSSLMMGEVIMTVVQKLRPGTWLSSRTLEALSIDIKTGRLKRPRHLTKELSVRSAHGTLMVVFKP